MSENDKAQAAPSLRFLHEVTATNLGKELEIIVIAVLVLFQNEPAKLVKQIAILEQIALWWALLKPKKGRAAAKARAERRVKLKALLSSLKARKHLFPRLSTEEKAEICSQLKEGDFKDGGVDEKKVKAILERVNIAVLQQSTTQETGKGKKANNFFKEKVLVECIVPFGLDTKQKKGGGKLGGYVVTTAAGKKKETIKEKKNRLSGSEFPLTAKVGQMMSANNIQEQKEQKKLVKDNYAAIVKAAIAHWHLA